MGTLTGKVALVTGASRGVGKGIAIGLGAAGATVYVTGRTLDEKQRTTPLTGTLQETADEVTKRGGKGIAVRCDHRNDAQVESVFERIRAEQGRLDILVNNAWAGYEGYHNDTHFAPDYPFWLKPVSYWDDNLAGVRWAYVASVFAAKLMVEQRGGLIINISNPQGAGNPAYYAAKSAVDVLAADMANELREHNVAIVALYPGLVRTEGVIKAAQYFDMTTSESPEFSGRAVAALAADAQVMQKTGSALVVAQLAQEYGFSDLDNPYVRQA
jgi:NAD(P)-dependent dehydrogenase (short-subunit alcohol dehydrogenase family)